MIKSKKNPAIVLEKHFLVFQYTVKYIYNPVYLKIKIKCYGEKLSTNYHNDRIPRESSHCIYLSVILIDSVFKIGENCYLQTSAMDES